MIIITIKSSSSKNKIGAIAAKDKTNDSNITFKRNGKNIIILTITITTINNGNNNENNNNNKSSNDNKFNSTLSPPTSKETVFILVASMVRK